MKRLLGLFLLLGLLSCTTMEQRQQATEGITFETNKSRENVIGVIVQVLSEEGFTIDTINEKYGLVNAKPQIMLTGELMKKVGEPGAGFVGTNTHLNHTIEFAATISEQGTVRLKALAYDIEEENFFDVILQNRNAPRSRSVDVSRSLKLNDYYAKRIKERLALSK